MKFLCDQCKTKYQIPDERVAGKTVRMKCRKCEHMIEVRAAVTETSVASSSPATSGATGSSPKPSFAPPPPPKPPLAASPSHAKPAAPRPAVQRSAMADADEWYASIDGVPLGPVPVAELRRKAMSGALKGESLVWREGMEEWRPVKTVPALAPIMREAVTARRPAAGAPGPKPSAPRAPSVTRSATARAPQMHRPATPAPSHAAPVMSRLATAEKLDLAPLPLEIEEEKIPEPVAPPAPEPIQVAVDPFAAAPLPIAAPAPPQPSPRPIVLQQKGPPPFLMIGVMLACATFGAVAGYATFIRPAPPPAPAQPAQTIYLPAPVAPSPPPTATAPVTVAPTPKKGGGHVAPKPAPSAPEPAKPLDVGPLGPTSPPLPPIPGPQILPNRPAAAGGSLTTPQIEKVVRDRQGAVKRACIDRGSSNVSSANVRVHVTVNGDGQVTDASATGNDPATSKCVEMEVMRWQFPPTGGQSVIDIPFHLVRQ